MKKLLLMACAISAMNVNFGMETGQETPTPSAPEDESGVHRFVSQQNESSSAAQEMLGSYLVPEDQKRIDEPTGNNNNAMPAEKPSFASDKLSQLLKVAHAHAPKRIQMVIDVATKTDARIKMCEAAAVAGAECCGYYCCPDFTYAVNLLSIGWVGNIIYRKFTAKEKTL